MAVIWIPKFVLSMYVAWASIVFLPCCVRAAINIVGSGASLPSHVYQAWMSTYEEVRREHADVSMNYYAKGSGVGLSRIKGELEPPVDFAGSDSVLTEADYVAHPDLQMFPTMAGSIVLAYHLPGTPRITLSREAIVGIFNGTISFWNDTKIQETNDKIGLPGERILVTARADKSGSTEIFTRALSAFSDSWRLGRGVFSRGLNKTGYPMHWNPEVVSFFGRGVYDVLYYISLYQYTIGYVSLGDAINDGVAFADVINLNGDVVTANAYSVQKSMDSFYGDLSDRLTTSIVDSPDPGAYPVAGYTYFVVRMTNNSDCAVKKEFLRFIMWYHSSFSAERTCTNLGFAPVSESVKRKISSTVITKIKCNNELVYDLVQADIERENKKNESTSEIALQIAIPCAVTLLILAVVVIIYLRTKAKRGKGRLEWNIAIEDVVFFEPSENSFNRSRSRSQKSSMTMESDKDNFNTEGASLSDIIHWPAKWNNYNVSVKIHEPIVLKPLSEAGEDQLCSVIRTGVQENVVRFFGLTTVGNERYILTEYCSKGILQDILHDNKLNLSTSLKFSISVDIINGLEFLHANGFVHGRLTTGRCLLDSRWTVKIADWEIAVVKSCFSVNPRGDILKNPDIYTVYVDDNRNPVENFWISPEMIKAHCLEPPTRAGDVYSFAICLQEIFTREEPFSEHADNISPQEVLVLILANNLRPHPTDDIPMKVRQIMEAAWTDDAECRPTAAQVKAMLKKANPGKKSVMDSMMETLEEYATHLERTVEDKAAELALVKQNVSGSYPNVLPPWLISKLSNNQVIKSQNLYKSCIACICVSGIGNAMGIVGADTVVDVLNSIFAEIIQCVIEENLLFIPHSRTPIVISTYNENVTLDDWIVRTVEMLLNLQSRTAHMQSKHRQLSSSNLVLRISLHLGSATISYLRPLSQVMAFGCGIETVKAMLDHSPEDGVLVCDEVCRTLDKCAYYHIERGGKIKQKDKSPLSTYRIRGMGEKQVQLTETTGTQKQISFEDDDVANIACVDC